MPIDYYIDWRYTKLNWCYVLGLNWQEVDIEINETLEVDFVYTPIINYTL